MALRHRVKNLEKEKIDNKIHLIVLKDNEERDEALQRYCKENNLSIPLKCYVVMTEADLGVL